MYSFFGCIIILIIGYAIYGRYVSHVFGPDDRLTPAIKKDVGADYVPHSSSSKER